MIAAATLIAIAAGAVTWFWARDPLSALPYSDAAMAVVSDHTRNADGRTLSTVALDAAALGQARIRLSLPNPLPAEPLPVVLVLGGQRTAGNSIALIGEAGRNAVVGYDWPLPTKLSRGVDLVADLPALHGNVMSIPGQIESALRWIKQQPWADRGRISIVGFSLGALAAPAIQRVLEARGHRIGWTVLAYGGSPLGQIAANHPRIQPDWLRPLVRRTIDVALRPFEPHEHLPRLHGCFFLLSGSADELIPAEAAARVVELAPPCKTVASIAGEHVGVGANEAAILEKATRASAAWLLAQGAINPMPGADAR